MKVAAAAVVGDGTAGRTAAVALADRELAEVRSTASNPPSGPCIAQRGTDTNGRLGAVTADSIAN